MKPCSSCGYSLPDDALFCELCGQPQAVDPDPEYTDLPNEEASPSKKRTIWLLVAAGIAFLLMVTVIVVVLLMMNGSSNEEPDPSPTTTQTMVLTTTQATTEPTTVQTTVVTTMPTVAPTAAPTVAPAPTPTLITKHVYPSSYYPSTVEYVVAASDGYVNLRHGPSTDYAIIREITNGTHVAVVAQEGDWLYASYMASEEGWIHISGLTTMQLLTTPSNPRSSMLISSTDYVVDSHDGVNMRYGPASETYGIKTIIPNGAHIVVTAVDGGWLYCSYSGMQGWVYKDFVRPY